MHSGKEVNPNTSWESGQVQCIIGTRSRLLYPGNEVNPKCSMGTRSIPVHPENEVMKGVFWERGQSQGILGMKSHPVHSGNEGMTGVSWEQDTPGNE